MEKWKLSKIKNLLQHICVYLLLYNPPLILNLNTASFDDDVQLDDNDDHYIIVIIIILLVVQLLLSLLLLLLLLFLLLLLLLLLLSLLPSSSSFFCVSECFLTGVWLFDIRHFVSLGKPFIRSRPSNRSAVLLLSFIFFVNFHSILSLFWGKYLSKHWY